MSGDLCWRCAEVLRLLSPGMQFPPGGGHLDQEALVPEVVVHINVGVAAAKGTEVSVIRREAACGLHEAEHGDLIQIFFLVAGAARDGIRSRAGYVVCGSPRHHL